MSTSRLCLLASLVAPLRKMGEHYARGDHSGDDRNNQETVFPKSMISSPVIVSFETKVEQ
jgi:hypothetical protein